MGLLKENIIELINLKIENKNLDFKESFNWKDNSKELKIGIIKDILAMMNTQGGGKLIFGVTDKDFELVGLSDSDYHSFDTTTVNDLLQQYSDPQSTCEVYKFDINGKKVIAIDIPEFSDIPIICAKDYHAPGNKHLLKKGNIYKRTNKGSSENISSSENMRELLDRAIKSRSEDIIIKIEGLLKNNKSDQGLENINIIEILTELLGRYKIEKNKNIDPKKAKLSYNIENFLDEKKRIGLKETTLEGYQQELEIFRKYFSEELIIEIDAEHIKKFLRYREDFFKIKTKSTLEKIRSILKVFFDWLVEEKVIDRNPVRKLKAYRIPATVVEVLNAEEVIEIQNACQTPRERAVVEVLLSTGCKLGELRKISLGNINWGNSTITIIATGQESRVVPLSSNAKYYLLQYLDIRNDNADSLFVTDRKPHREMSSRAIQDMISNITKRTSINKKITPRTFRNTFAKVLFEKGYPLNVLQALLGHKKYTNSMETSVKITNENIDKILNFHLW